MLIVVCVLLVFNQSVLETLHVVEVTDVQYTANISKTAKVTDYIFGGKKMEKHRHGGKN